jgi:hypothetical protein
MSPHRRNYCEDCDWSATTETRTKQELSMAAIGHAVEHSHDLNSDVIADLKAPF